MTEAVLGADSGCKGSIHCAAAGGDIKMETKLGMNMEVRYKNTNRDKQCKLTLSI
jgi:hypothetical protein